MPRSFTMTKDHMLAFSQQQRRRFEDEMVAYLQEEYPTECAKLGEAGLRELISEGVEKAKRYNIILECDVARYIELMLALSPDFDGSAETPSAKDILTDLRLTGEQKLTRIYEQLMFGGAGSEEGNR